MMVCGDPHITEKMTGTKYRFSFDLHGDPGHTYLFLKDKETGVCVCVCVCACKCACVCEVQVALFSSDFCDVSQNFFMCRKICSDYDGFTDTQSPT